METLRAQAHRLGAWLKAHPNTALLIGGGFLICLSIMVSMLVLAAQPKPVPPARAPAFVPPKKFYYSPLTGNTVEAEAATTAPVTAIMIENSPDARPQSGLQQAEVVYEAIAEGGITRFVALYQQNKPKLVGPVRSVRLYFVDWLTPYDASVVHVGGSARALKLVRNGSYRDLDQFFNPGSFWRASDRYAPHNVYTSFKKIDSLNKSKKYKSSSPKPIERVIAPAHDKEKIPVQADQPVTARKISLKISSDLFNPSYVYDAKMKVYKRYLGGEKHRDRENGQITAKVVVALEVTEKTVMEDGARESITTSGSGKGYVFQNGVATKVTWRKSGRAGQLSFTAADGEVFRLERGTTWITAIPSDRGDVSWQK